MGETRTIPLMPEKVVAVFRAISDVECAYLGLSSDWARPEWMVISVLPVPPMAVRPSIQMEGKGRSEDDLTHKISDIIKANTNLKRHETEGSPAHVVAEVRRRRRVWRC